MFFYLQRLPMLLQLQADELYREMTTASPFRKVLDQVTQQRDAAIQQMASSLRQEQQAFVSNLEAAADRSTDHLVRRLAVLALILLASTAMAVFAYRSLSQRWQSRATRASEPPALQRPWHRQSGQ
jgi:hypothetical protein